MKDKVEVISGVNAQVVLNVPELSLKRTWAKRGAKVLIPIDQLEEAMYQPGVEYMFKNGILYIQEKEILKELGLLDEVDGKTKEPVLLTDAIMTRYLQNAPVVDFKEFLKSLSVEQVRTLADFAVEHEMAQFDKSELMEKICGFNVMKAIELNRADKAARNAKV